MIHHLRDMVGPAHVRCARGRAVPEPRLEPWRRRARDAWAVLAGRAFAVEWPKPGELEDALEPKLGVAIQFMKRWQRER